MSRNMGPLFPQQLTSFDLETFMPQAAALHQRNAETFTTPFPKAPSRWLSPYHYQPRPIAWTAEGEVEGGRSGLIGAAIDLRCTRSLCAPSYSPEGGPCYDPASAFFLEVATQVDRYPDDACCCHDLRQHDKGQRSRDLAGLQDAIPGEDDGRPFRRRVGADAIDAVLAVLVDFCREFGLLKGAWLATDGQRESTHARFTGGASFGKDCDAFALDDARRQALCDPLQHGAKRLQLVWPFPDVVDKVPQLPTKQGHPHEPRVAWLEVESLPPDSPQSDEHEPVAARLSLPPDDLPPLRLKWSHLSRAPQGERGGHCPKVPKALEAGVGSPIDTKAPPKKERGCGSLHHKTTDLHVALGRERPLGNSTYAANTHAGRQFQAHRAKGAIPLGPAQMPLGDAAYDVTANSQWLRSQGGVPIMDDPPRNANLSPQALLKRGDDQHGTPSAPCGRLCRSNGYD